MRSFVRLFGLPVTAEGMLLPGGTAANLQAVVLARSKASAERVRLYVSDQCHFSVARSARVAGFADEDIVSVRATGRGSMDTADLEARIAADRDAGHAPGMVVATLGTTSTGAIDPLDEVAAFCAREKIWFPRRCVLRGCRHAAAGARGPSSRCRARGPRSQSTHTSGSSCRSRPECC